HFQAVASLDDSTTWLERAQRGGWSVDRLASTARGANTSPPAPHVAFKASVEAVAKKVSSLNEADDRLLARAVRAGLADAVEELGSPTIVWCVLTPFGRTGPKAAQRASDLSVQAQSGVMYMTGDPDRAPVACSSPTSSHHGCADAVAGIMAALLQREKTGRGQ